MIYTQHILPYTNPFHVFDAFWSTCDNMHESKPTARKQFLYPNCGSLYIIPLLWAYPIINCRGQRWAAIAGSTGDAPTDGSTGGMVQ